MDPIAATQLAADVAGIFLKVVTTVKDVIETMKGAKEALIELLSRCERVRLYLELFRSLTSRLSNPVEKSISLSFNVVRTARQRTRSWGLFTRSRMPQSTLNSG